MEKPHIPEIDKGLVLGFIGGSKFPSSGVGYSKSKRKALFVEISRLLAKLKPTSIYLIPSKGVNIELHPILMALNIPYILVNPYPNYNSTLTKKDKNNLLRLVAGSKTIISLSTEPPKSRKERSKLFFEAVEFIGSRAEIFVTVSTENPESNFNKAMEALSCGADRQIYSLVYSRD